MLDWWIGTRLEGDQFEVTEENFEEGKCSKGPLYLWTLQFIYMHVSKFEISFKDFT